LSESLSTKGCEIELSGVTRNYGSTIAVDGVDLSVRAGEFLTFLGPSGGGKTTTLNLIAGFDEATAGSIRIDNANMVGVPPHKRDIGVVFQNYALFPHMTVFDNIAYPLVQRKVPKPERAERVNAALRSVSLAAQTRRYPGQLSGGQQQRVALARALVFRPKLLLMDEPLGALDRALREELQLEIRRIHREAGSTAIYVTHDQEEALVLSDRIAVFNQGKIEQLGTPRELYDSPATLFVGRFLGESTVVSGSVVGHEDGVVVVQGPNGTFRARGTASLGSEVTILVRPEKQRVVATSASPGSENSLECRLLDQIFVGATWKIRVELPDGDVGVIRSSEPADSSMQIGDKVFVTWQVDGGVLLIGRTSPEAQRAMSATAV